MTEKGTCYFPPKRQSWGRIAAVRKGASEKIAPNAPSLPILPRGGFAAWRPGPPEPEVDPKRRKSLRSNDFR